MRVFELVRLIADFPPHYFIVLRADGWTCELGDVEPEGDGIVGIDIEIPEGYTLAPKEPSIDMLIACAKFGFDLGMARKAWEAMIAEHDSENE